MVSLHLLSSFSDSEIYQNTTWDTLLCQDKPVSPVSLSAFCQWMNHAILHVSFFALTSRELN